MIITTQHYTRNSTQENFDVLIFTITEYLTENQAQEISWHRKYLNIAQSKTVNLNLTANQNICSSQYDALAYRHPVTQLVGNNSLQEHAVSMCCLP